jgi:hypothetical protein
MIYIYSYGQTFLLLIKRNSIAWKVLGKDSNDSTKVLNWKSNKIIKNDADKVQEKSIDLSITRDGVSFINN